MFRFAAADSLQDLTISGRNLKLVTRTWTLSFHMRWFGAGARYERPYSIQDEFPRRIHDHVMLARAASLAAVAVAILIRKVTQ